MLGAAWLSPHPKTTIQPLTLLQAPKSQSFPLGEEGTESSDPPAAGSPRDPSPSVRHLQKGAAPKPRVPHPLPGQRFAGGDAGHDDALRSRCGHGFEGPSPELLEELLLALLHAGHGPGAARRGRSPRC